MEYELDSVLHLNKISQNFEINPQNDHNFPLQWAGQNAANAQLFNSFGQPMDPYSQYQPFPQQQTTNFYPGNGAIVNSQVTDARPGYTTVHQSTVHHPGGGISWQWSGRPNTMPPNRPPYPSYPGSGSFYPQSPGMNPYPGGQPIVNSQVTDVQPGFVTYSQSTNNPYIVSWQWNGNPNMGFNDPSYSLYRSNKPGSPSQSQSHVVNVHSGQRPTVNSQVTNLHAGSRPVVNSQVTDV